MSAQPQIPEDEDVIERCGDPCPEAPDLDLCLVMRAKELVGA